MRPIQHRDNVPWDEAPLPPRRHRCFVQSSGEVDGYLIQRCPCGAIRRPGEPWVERNYRRGPAIWPWVGVFISTVVMAVVLAMADPTTFNGQDLLAVVLVIIGGVIAIRGIREDAETMAEEATWD